MVEFYCCDEMKHRLKGLGREYYRLIMNAKYCIDCGKRMQLNSGF